MMESLYNQVNPYLTSVPAEDQTFRQYVDELLKSSSGFTGTFVNNSASKKDNETPTTTITDGLFKKFLPESSSGNGSSASPSSGSPMSIADQEALGFGLTQNSKAIGQLGSLFGVPSFVGSTLANAIGNYNLDQAMDRTSSAFDVFSTPQMPGVSTAYGPQGAYTISTPESILASDIANFGGTAYGTIAGSQQSNMLAAQEAGMFDTNFGGGDYGASDNSGRSDPSSYGSMADTAND